MDKKIKNKKEDFANYIVNNMNFGQAIQVLIERAKKVSNYMVDNDCKKEEFHLYLFEEVLPEPKEGAAMGLHLERKRKTIQSPPQKKKKKKRKGLFGRLIDAVFPYEEEEEEDSSTQKRRAFSTRKE